MSCAHSHISRRRFLQAAGLAAAAPLIGPGVPGASAAQAADKNSQQYDESRFTVCDMCFNRCGAIARIRGGKVVQLDPNPHFTKSRGMLCGRGAAGVAQLYDPDRIKQPLLRVGERGEGKWKPISWNEALDTTASRLMEIAAKYTRCGVVFSVGADMQTQFVKRFAKAFGSWSVCSQESLCLYSMNRSYLDTFGENVLPDIKNCRYVLMPGSNRFESLVFPDTSDLMEAMQNGAKLAVVDPRYTHSAALATEWLQIKPGTDMALALALIHVILKEQIYDAPWVEANTFGLAELQAHVVTCTPEWAAAETDIPAEVIVRVAREMAAAAPRALVYPGRRTSDYTDSTQIRRAWCILNGILGNFDREGGLLVPPALKMGAGIPLEAPFYEDTPRQKLDKDRSTFTFPDEMAFCSVRDAVLEEKPHSVGGWVVFKTNPLQTAPDQAKTLAMIARLEFVVAIDISMSDTAFMSDLILPAHTYLERQDPCQMLSGGSVGNCVVWREPAVPPLYDTRNPFDILKGLAERMDLEKYFDFTVEEFRAKQLETLEGAEQALREKGVYHPEGQKLTGLYEGKNLKTSSKKIDLWNSRYEKKGIDPLPVYRRPHTEPGLRLVAGRTALLTQTSSQNNALLHELVPTNTLHIHPDAAGKLGISDGDLVEVHGNDSVQRLKAEFNYGIREDTVYMHSGFGSLSSGLSNVYRNGANIAALMHDAADEISGNAAHHESFVTVTKVGKA